MLVSRRRVEVLANGLPLWQGAQVAVDTTLISVPGVSRWNGATWGRAGPRFCRAAGRPP